MMKKKGLSRIKPATKQMLLETIQLAFRGLDYIFPKDSRIIVFGSNGTRMKTGSPKAMFEYLMKKSKHLKPYFVVRNPSKENEISASSFRGLLILLRARYAVTSHGLDDFGIFRHSRRTKMIATWHGISLKASGYMNKGLTSKIKRTIEAYTRQTSFCIASSKYDASLLSLMFGYSGDRICITGQPRNDSLVDHKQEHGSMLSTFIPSIQKGARVFLYAPTFRNYCIDDDKLNKNILPFSDFSRSRLEEILQKYDAVLLLRMHMDDTRKRSIIDSERIHDLSTNLCPDVNEILPDIDLVISDYSSIANDFLLTGRPLVFLPYDLGDYDKREGLIVDDYDFWTPGPKCLTLAEFEEYLNDIFILGKDEYVVQRNHLRKILHSHQSKCSTLTVLKEILKNR